MGMSKLRYEDIEQHPDIYNFPLPKWAFELAQKGYKGVSAVDFYDDIFMDDLAEQRMPEDYRTGEYCGIAIETVPKVDKEGNPVLDKDGKQKWTGKRTQITQGNIALYNLIDRSENFCLISPISYAGRQRTNENARFMYAFCIEIDNLQEKAGLEELIYSWERKTDPVPKPTYIVCSGNGLHLYYVFERPVPLWENVFEALAEYKKYLTPWLWNKYITKDYEKIQWESLNQPFRVVGTVTKNKGYALAFEIGEKVSIEYMNKFVPEDMAITAIYKSKHTLEEAKKLYPKWYQRRIIEGKERGHWNRYKPIYYNWIEKILDVRKDKGAVVGKRYNCLENLCSLAVQCNIEPEQVEADCRRVAERFERLTVDEDNHFTEYDVLCALRTYHEAKEGAYRRKIEYISKKTGIELVPNRRNGRTRAKHLEVARAIRDINNENWRKGNGRKEKKEQVYQWRQLHPEGKKADCHRETKIDPKTIRKWWDYKPTPELQQSERLTAYADKMNRILKK